jgi:hypothetical protein
VQIGVQRAALITVALLPSTCMSGQGAGHSTRRARRRRRRDPRPPHRSLLRRPSADADRRSSSRSEPRRTSSARGSPGCRSPEVAVGAGPLFVSPCPVTSPPSPSLGRRVLSGSSCDQLRRASFTGAQRDRMSLRRQAVPTGRRQCVVEVQEKEADSSSLPAWYPASRQPTARDTSSACSSRLPRRRARLLTTVNGVVGSRPSCSRTAFTSEPRSSRLVVPWTALIGCSSWQDAAEGPARHDDILVRCRPIPGSPHSPPSVW